MDIKFDGVNLSLNGCPILNNINLDINSGEFVGIIGPNGAGKSSILRCLYNHYKPTSGEIFVDNTNIKDMDMNEIAKNVSAVLQEMPTEFGMTVYDVVIMGRLPHQKMFANTEKVDNNFVKYALKKVGMENYATRQFSSLSGGEKQRVIIARAFVQEPQILLMDEPTNHLDINNQVAIMKMARDLKITTVAIIHDLNLAAAFCDKIYVIKDNTVFANGRPSEVLSSDLIQDVFNIKVYVNECEIDNHKRINIHYL